MLARTDPILATPLELSDEEFQQLVDFVRNEFFASTRFAFNENRGVGGGNDSNLIQYSTKTRARPYNAFKPIPAFS